MLEETKEETKEGTRKAPPPPPTRVALPPPPLRLVSAESVSAEDTSFIPPGVALPPPPPSPPDTSFTSLRAPSSGSMRRYAIPKSAAALNITWAILSEKFNAQAAIIKILIFSFFPLATRTLDVNSANFVASVALAAALSFIGNMLADLLLPVFALCYCPKVEGRRQSMGLRHRARCVPKKSANGAALETLDLIPGSIAEESRAILGSVDSLWMLALMPVASVTLSAGWLKIVDKKPGKFILSDMALRMLVNYALLSFEFLASTEVEKAFKNSIAATVLSCFLKAFIAMAIVVVVKKLEDCRPSPTPCLSWFKKEDASMDGAAAVARPLLDGGASRISYSNL